MYLKKFTVDDVSEIKGKKIYCYEKSVSYLQELLEKYDLLDNIVAVVDDFKRNQGNFSLNGKEIAIVGTDYLATVDLKDADNDPIENCYLGSVIIHTKDTNPFALTYAVNTSDTKSAFSVLARLTNGNEGDTELEANTLSGITFNIYEGKDTSGNLIRSVTKIDDNLEENYL